ncbi:MAG: flagellar motor protein MotD [Thiohalomonadales bacterium]
MARKVRQEEHENHERWLVSYADFITLLFAFFVVMYSISSVNEGKYRVLSSSLVSAFAQTNKAIEPIQYGKKIDNPIKQKKILADVNKDHQRIGVEYEIMPTPKEIAQMQKIADEISHDLRKLVESNDLKVTKTTKGVEIEIKSKILFSSGQAILHAKAKKILNDISKVLISLENPINVEGFTDNIPIQTRQFPSNWELSASRAANVVHLFSNSGINPVRLSAIGYGEYQPIADNGSELGRSKNRRINIVVLNRITPKRKRLPSLNKGGYPNKIMTHPNKADRSKLDLGGVLDLSTESLTNKKAKGQVPKIISLGGDDLTKPSPQKEKILKNRQPKPAIFTLPLPTMLPGTRQTDIKGGGN